MVWMREVHLHLLENFDEDRLPELVKERVSERWRSVAISRLRSIDVGYRSYDLVLKMVVDSGRQFGRLADIKCTRFALRTVCKYCFGGLPVARTRANFQYKKQLEAAGIVGDMRHACLYCFLQREVCVLESEWHFAFFCPLFSNLRSGPIARQRAEYNNDAEFRALPCSSDTFSDFLTRCVQEPALAQSLGSYTRLSLQERERWLSETVGETLHVDPAQINALRMYSSTTDFAKGVAKHAHSVLYEEYVEMEAMQPYVVRHDGNAVCLPNVIALPNGLIK